MKSEGVAAKFLLYDILSDPDNRDISFGVNSILNTSIAQAVKTGTSSDFRDNHIVVCCTSKSRCFTSSPCIFNCPLFHSLTILI